MHAVQSATPLGLTVPERVILLAPADQTDPRLVHDGPAHGAGQPVADADLLVQLTAAVIRARRLAQNSGVAGPSGQDAVVQVDEADPATIREEVPGDFVAQTEEVGLQQNRQQEEAVEAGKDEERDHRRGGRSREAGVCVGRVVEPLPGRVEALEEDIQQLNDDPFARHDHLETVPPGDVESRPAVGVDQDEYPVEDVVEHVDREGQEEMEDEYGHPDAAQSLFRRVRVHDVRPHDEVLFGFLQR